MARLGAAQVPVSAVFDTEELRQDQFLRQHQMFVEVDHPAWGKVIIPGSPIRLADSPVEVHPAPLLGQHNEEVYRELLGLSHADIEELKAACVI
jgi:crotonobetainyl-CoA:carnitine CoA-transferase CaiB-like acyl-CoA transferase